MNSLRDTSETYYLPPSSTLSLFTGRAVFKLYGHDDHLKIGEGASSRLVELDIGYPYAHATRFSLPQGVVLGQQDRVVIGRSTGIKTEGDRKNEFPYDRQQIDRGIVIYGPDGKFDEERTRQLADGTLVRALNMDGLLSRRHAEIEVVGDHVVTVTDLGSRNGTDILFEEGLNYG